jgi:hypothetical protein
MPVILFRGDNEQSRRSLGLPAVATRAFITAVRRSQVTPLNGARWAWPGRGGARTRGSRLPSREKKHVAIYVSSFAPPRSEHLARDLCFRDCRDDH